MIKPPEESERLLFVSSNKNLLYAIGAVTLLLLFSGMTLFILFNPEMSWLYVPFFIITIIYLIISYIIGIFGKEFDLERHQSFVNLFQPMHFKPEARPSIDIYYACCGEDLDVQKNALTHIVNLQLVYGPNAHVYILDDSKDSVTRPIYEKLKLLTENIFYVVRDDRPYLKKAGNLRNAFRNTNGEFIVIFDADFVPSTRFLYDTLPYLFFDNRIGIVQTPQFFQPNEQSNWISYGTAYVQELFYRLIQVSRQSFDGSICVGTNAVYRRSSLEPFGGTADIAYSEDVRTGFRVTAAGEKVKYLPLNLAKGLCPDTLPAFFLQQHRWSLGSIDLFLSKEFWASKISIMQRFCYLSGMLYYVSTGLGIVFINLPSIYLVIFKPHYILWFNAFFSVPSFLFGTIYNAKWSRFEWSISAMMSRLVSYYANLFALYERITGNLTPWQATGVAKKTPLYGKFQKLLFWNAIITFTVIIVGVALNIDHGIYNFIPTLFFQGLNFYLSMRILRDQI